MLYNIHDLVYLFFIYSFVGWCIEVCYSAIRRKQFINRGFVNSCLCPIYGFASVLFAIFLPELTAQPFFLFLGGALLATILEYATGMTLEKIFRRQLWDYSESKFNLNGYVCLPCSLLWGALAVVTMLFTNPLLCRLFALIPHTLTIILQWIGIGLLLLDFLTTAMAVLGMEITAKRLAQLSEDIQQTSHFLENRLSAHVQKRMQRSFPSINRDLITTAWQEKQASANDKVEIFAEGCCFYKLFALFFIGAFLGDITETIYCLITSGVLMSRSSVVYGPFSIVWGLGCSFLTLFLYRYRSKSDRAIFIAGTLLGGIYEYMCSVFTELVFGTVFWDYSGFAFNLGGRINLLYCFFWGIAAVVWLKGIYPKLSYLIEHIPVKIGKIVSNFLIVFMLFNMLISSMALSRYSERNLNPESLQNPSGIEKLLDERFTDERMERIYPNAKIVK